jgi:hypothetical protein
MLWLLAQQCVETWQVFRNFNLFLVISFEKENIIKYIRKRKTKWQKFTTKKNCVSGLNECWSPFQTMFGWFFVFTRLVEFGS